MSTVKTGQSHIAARARLMLLLGEQLITDEVAAVSELVKNSYDADATKVTLSLVNVSEQSDGVIIVRDNGNGMTLETVLSSWLELGTLSKARKDNLQPRFSEKLKRVYLGEKGLGRLAVHKLGRITELVTKRPGTNLETRIVFDWTEFEKNQGFLEDVPINWEVRESKVFLDSLEQSGTQITIKELRRIWTSEMINRIFKSIKALKSPFETFSDFEIELKIKDKLAPVTEIPDMQNIIRKATYLMEGTVGDLGKLNYRYAFNRPDLPDMKREKVDILDIREPEDFSNDRKPECGSFNVRFYAWELLAQDLRAVFGDTSISKEMIKPNSGVKVFRDGFRVLPYGNIDNDWLSMDMERVKQFERLSRNQIIGAIEISSTTNHFLLDKTDREGLIDNEAFRDFYSLVKSAIAQFEAERQKDRQKLKEATGRTRDELRNRAIYSQSLSNLTNIVSSKSNIDTETKIKIDRLITEARASLDNLLSEKEQPLLVAASIGLTYMMPTHEVKRDLEESLRILRNIREKGVLESSKIDSVISLLRQADEVVSGIGKLMQKTAEDESFPIEHAIRDAFELMHYRLERSNIKFTMEIRDSSKVKGSFRLTTILLLNFLDNSFYWLQRNKITDRQVKIITETYGNDLMLIVSDNGPGFKDDDINTLTLPFFSRKPNGMGLGLYIADRIVRMNGGGLKILGQKELSGLLSGANIAAILKKLNK